MAALHIDAQHYSWITGAFQGTIMLQPVVGYVLDVAGMKYGMALFALAWSLISMAHGLAFNWQSLAFLRGLLGFAEGTGNPGGMKVIAEWFPPASAAWPAASTISAPRSDRCWRRPSWPGRSRL